MRLLITFEPIDKASYYDINKYDIQGFIYNLLRESDDFSEFHDIQGFKFFSFSNIFPVSDFERNSLKKLIISSPNNEFLYALQNVLGEKTDFRLNKYKMELLKSKLLKDNFKPNFISATPIVLYEDNQSNKYYSFKQSPDFNFFFNRIKDNALKKYNAFYGDEFELTGDLFTNFEFVREVSVRVKKNDNWFIIIGSLWKNLKFELNKDNKKFYKFLFNNGIGEKNSLGFGFLNSRG